MEFRVLGTIEVSQNGSGPIPLGGPKQRAVLAHLLMRADHVVPTDVLIDEVWGEEPPETARNALQSYASHLRKALGAERVEGSRSGYRLRAEPAEIDVARFQTLLRDARRILPIDARAAVGAFDHALALWRGPAFADLAGERSLRAEAARLDELRLGAIEDRIEALLTIGRHAEVIGELEGLTARNPLRERFWEQLMLALYRSGRQAEALGAFGRAREILADELGIDPSPGLRKVHERILAQSPELDPGGEPLRGYRLLERLGQDATGVLYRATQPNVGREVAIRVIHEHRANDPAFVRRFDADAQAVATLEHPHVTPVYDYWREPGRAYVVTRYLRGGSLDELIGDLPAERAAPILEQIVSALGAAHRRGVGHGDLRPSNVLFDEEGNAYLTDFSIGRDGIDASDDLDSFAALARATLGERLPMSVNDALREAEHPPRTGPVSAVFAELVGAFGPTTNGSAPSALETRNPYKGLRPFLEADVGDFFGREGFVDRMLERMAATDRPRFIAVVGPSGSGKSSVVRAGLVAAIRRGSLPGSETWLVTEMHPGHHPFEALDAALMRVAVDPPAGLLGRLEAEPRGLLEIANAIVPTDAQLLLIVDQLEEIFTLTESEDDRSLLLESLRVASTDPTSRIRIVATLRADFYDRPLLYPRIGQLLGSTTELLSALTPEELERAIVRPAERAGLTIDGALVPQVAADVAEQPGALPLVQYALTELYDRREEGRLTLDAYRDIGGVGGALAASAEHLFATRQPAGRHAVRQLFLRLVTLGEGAADTRRRVKLSELSAIEVDGSAMESALDAYGRHRLLTFDRDPSTREPTVEVAHEALLGAWERLRGWIEEAREDVRMHRRLSGATREWEHSERDASFLLGGSRLDQFDSWASSTTLALGLEERGFLAASITRRDEDRARESARRDRERVLEHRSVKRLRALVALFAAAVVLAGTLTTIAVNRNASAQRASRLAFGRELLAGAAKSLEVDRELAILLAFEALRTTQDVDASMLREAEELLRRAAPVVAIDTTETVGSAVVDGAGTPDGSTVALIGNGGSIGVWDLRDGSRRLALPSAGRSCHIGATALDSVCPDVSNVSLSADARVVATGDAEGVAHVWDLTSGRELTTVSTHTPDEGLAFGTGADVAPLVALSPDGHLLATVGRDESIRMWDASTETQMWALTAQDTAPASAAPLRRDFFRAGFGPDGTELLLCSWGAAPIVVDVATGETVISPNVGSGCFQASADGSRVVLAEFDRIEVWDLSQRTRVAAASYAEIAFYQEEVAGTALSPDGRILGVIGGPARNIVFLRDSSTLASLDRLEHRMQVLGVGFSPDGTRIATVSTDGAARVWDARSGELIFTSLDEPTDLDEAWFVGDGSKIALLYSDGRLLVHSIAFEDVIEIARDRLTRGFTDEECRTYLHVPRCPAG